MALDMEGKQSHGVLFNTVTDILGEMAREKGEKYGPLFSHRLACTHGVMEAIEIWYDCFLRGETLTYRERLEERKSSQL